MKKIEFGELRIGGTARKNLIEVCNSHWASAGPKVAEFEKKFAGLFGYEHCAMVSSGTSADIAALLTLYDLGAKQGDEVICPALAFVAVGNAVRAAGFTPKFVDVKWDMNLDETLVEAAITSKTRAILAVNTMGKPCEMKKLRQIADKYNLLLISDNCEGHGSQFNSLFMSGWADISTYSFYIAHLVTCGEGGAVCTNRKDLHDIVKSVRSHGRQPDSLYFDHVRFGLNLKANDLEASIGLEAIDTFWDTFHTRKKTYYMLWEICEPFIGSKVWISEEEKNCDNCPHAFSVTLTNYNKDMFKAVTDIYDDYKIHWKRNFGSMPTQHKCFEYLGHKLGEFPVAEHIGDMGLHLPIHQYLSKEDVDRLITATQEVLDLL